MAIQIKRAVRERIFLKIAIGGSTGSGKTLSGILLANGLAPTGKIGIIDTENRSASYYADCPDKGVDFAFDVIELEAPFTTQKYLEALRAFIEDGCEAVVIDSLTHEWAASGGILDQKSQKDARGGNSFTNWNEMKQLHNKFVEMILQSKVHVICTLRSKMEYVLEQDEKGKSSVRKVGLAPISSDGMEYEFGVFFDVDRATHHAIATKDRTGLFEGRSFLIGKDIGRELREWRDSGAPLSPEPPEPTTAPAPATATQGTATPAAPRATQPRAQIAAQPVAQGAKAPTSPAPAVAQPRPSPVPAQVSPATSPSEPPAEWVEALVELAEVTVDMPEKTRSALIADFEKEGPSSLPAVREEIAKMRFILDKPEPTTAGEVFSQMPRPEGAEISQEASDFVDGIADGPESPAPISQVQYEALNKFIEAFKINRDALRSYMAKAGHLLPGKNGPTLSRMKAEEFAKLRDKLTNQAIAAKGESWSQRTVRVINSTAITTYNPTTHQPITAAS